MPPDFLLGRIDNVGDEITRSQNACLSLSLNTAAAKGFDHRPSTHGANHSTADQLRSSSLRDAFIHELSVNVLRLTLGPSEPFQNIISILPGGITSGHCHPMVAPLVANRDRYRD